MPQLPVFTIGRADALGKFGSGETKQAPKAYDVKTVKLSWFFLP